MSFEHWMPVYLDACASEGKTRKTLAAYGDTLQWYVRLAKADGLPLQVDQVTPPDVYRYLAAVRRRGVSDVTQHRRHREVKHFFSWLKRMGVVQENAFQKVPLVRLEDKIVQPYSREDIARMLAVLDSATLLGARDMAITLFLLDTGVRASELTGLDLEDVDLAAGRARILHGKGKKQRVVAFGPGVREVLRAYLRLRGEAAGPCFETKQGRRLRPEGLLVIYQRLGAKAGVVKVHPHRFRHTFATVAIQSAAREIDVQHLLGHSDSTMVRRYTRTYDAARAALAHSTFSPVEQFFGR